MTQTTTSIHDSTYLESKFDAALDWSEYLATGTDAQQSSWQEIYDQSAVTDTQQQVLSGFARDMRVLVVSGIWCGDCVQQCPLIQRIAEANAERIAIRWVDRDAHSDLADQLLINAGKRVPVALFMAEDFELVSWFGDRTLSRYRALAARQLGAACPLPGATLDENERMATQADWLDEFERVQLLLRLSTRLRHKHGD